MPVLGLRFGENSMRPKMLLHICCAPCSTHVVDVLKDDYDVTGHFTVVEEPQPGTPPLVTREDVKPSASMTLETAQKTTNSKGEPLDDLDTATLAGMANSLTKGLNNGKYSDDEREEELMELDAIKVILAERNK